MRRLFSPFVIVILLALQTSSGAQVAATLQIHFMDVGQGDGALLIAPNGETVLFDNGVGKHCDKPLTYLGQLGITKIDYQVISHYHLDHFGCTADVLGRFPLQHFSFDRGGSYHSDAFNTYVQTVGVKRRTATEGHTITLDATSTTPVVITFKALNGNGVQTDNENDESVVALVSFGSFRAEIGGDLSGFAENSYADIETSVAPKVGQVDVYKVHHHGSQYSTNSAWLQAVQPRVAIVSSGDGNGYGHPTELCIERLHDAGVKAYWTEQGNGVPPEPGMDIVGGTIVVEVPRQTTTTYSVRPTKAGLPTDTYQTWMSVAGLAPAPAAPTFAWSQRSNLYHDARCRVVGTIAPSNLRTGAAPPPGKTLHKDCPL